MKYLLGIDFGGGASKATLLSDKGDVVATHTFEYPTHNLGQGFVEQDPDDWVGAAVENIRALLQKSGIDPKDVAALSFDAATHTAVLCDRDFRPLRPAIYWTDVRSKREVDYLKKNYGASIFTHAFHHPDTIWTLPQLMWVRRNEPEVWQKTEKILFAKDYVRHFFTGDYVTDVIEAEGSMLFDYSSLGWSQELCGILGVDPAMLPRTVRPTSVAGKVTAEAAEATGIPAGTTVFCGTTDTVMEIYAAGALEEGDMTVKLATAGRICVIAKRPYRDSNLINYSHIVGGLWYPGTATKSCAASNRWFRDTFGGDYGELDKMAETVEPGCGGLIFHPYLNGELTPYADPDLCGSFTGIRASHTKAHFARAVLEGVAFSMLDCERTLASIGIPHKENAVMIGMGGKSPLWRQILSDVLGIRLTVKQYSDSSFGTAMLAGVGAGIFSSFDAAVRLCNREISETVPDPAKHELYGTYFQRYRAIVSALSPIYDGGLG
ncbi:MAG: xylulokinase [Clostridia bacterium]|nr:xylulokinase [Clostridia bacterium]